MTKRKPDDVPWESFVEEQIREAQAAGDFDQLPGFGRPLDDIDEPYDDWWWIKRKLRRENLSLMPPALEIRVDVERTRGRVWELDTETQVRQAITALNERIARANLQAIWGPPSTTMPLDPDAVVAEWQARRQAS